MHSFTALPTPQPLIHRSLCLRSHSVTHLSIHSFIHSSFTKHLLCTGVLSRAPGGGPASLTGTMVPLEGVLSTPYHLSCLASPKIMPLPQIHSEEQAKQVSGPVCPSTCHYTTWDANELVTCFLRVTLGSASVLRPRAGRKLGGVGAMGGSRDGLMSTESQRPPDASREESLSGEGPKSFRGVED